MSVPVGIKKGDEFHRLTAIRFTRKLVVGNSKRNKTYWEFQCQCGTVFETVATAVKTGAIKSCGCLRTDARRRQAQINIAVAKAKREGTFTKLDDYLPPPLIEQPIPTVRAADRKPASLLTGLLPGVVIEQTASNRRVIHIGE